MEYRNLGRAGVKVSAIGVGCNQFGAKVDKDGTKAIVHRALDEGINLFDTANVYGSPDGRSEEFLGAALQGHRENIVLATKGRFKMGEGPNEVGASRLHILSAVEASLKRLGTDHVDLYQIHAWDETTPIEETMRVLDDLVHSGKVRYIGTSQFSAWQLCRSNDVAEMMGWESFATIQAHYNLLERDAERELIPYCEYSGVGVLPYFPLAGGILTGKYTRGEPPPAGSRGEFSPYVKNRLTDKTFDKLDKLRSFAESRGHTLHELAIAWLLSRKTTPSVMAGATNPDQVTANVATLSWRLSVEELTEIKEIL
jgi:aryl-alcohol dehydrogenase-like predicted oxidoreductase